MKKVKIIGVPEHFNLPWHLAIEDGAFEDRGIDLSWTDIPEGTGKMAQMLSENETDLAIILTEGIVKSIADGNPSKIVQIYVESPLLWGIHVAHDSNYQSVASLKSKTAAISRFGSGSHLMAIVNAHNEGWPISEVKFKTVNNLDGAVEALTQGEADYFMWEHFTTKPLVTQKVFRHLGDCPTPWPCFVIAATDKFIKDHPSLLPHILEIINLYTTEFKMIPSMDRTIANKYGQQLDDVREWLSLTNWGQIQIDSKSMALVQQRLYDLQMIPEKLPENQLLVS